MILITGGTGALGKQLVERITNLGERVRLLVLPGEKVPEALCNSKIEIWYGNVSNKGDLENICEDISTVLHLAAIIVTNNPQLYRTINIDGTKYLINESQKSGVSHFIYVSSASVMYPNPTDYSNSKRVCEKLVRESGLPWTIIRPTLIYNESGAQELNMFLDSLVKFKIVPVIGNGLSLKRPVYSGTVVDGLVKVALRKNATMKVYYFSGNKPISMIDFTKLCLENLGLKHKPIIHLPVWICCILAIILKLFMKNPPLTWSIIAGVTQDANFNPSEAIKDLGYSPESFYDKLPKCVKLRIYEKETIKMKVNELISAIE